MSKKRSRRAARRLARKRAVRLFLFLAFLLFFFLFFRLETVLVRGNVHNTPSQITQLILERPVAENTLLTKLLNTNRKIKGQGFIDSVNVEILGRNSVRVIVTERPFVGCVESGGGFWYFDGSGQVMARTASRLPGELMPLVEGIELRSDPVLMSTLPISYTKAFSMLGMLANRIRSTPDLLPDKVVFVGGDMTLIYGPVTVLLGGGEKLELRLKELTGILPELKKGYSGVLHLESYDGSQSGIIFDKDDGADAEEQTSDADEAAGEQTSETRGNTAEASGQAAEHTSASGETAAAQTAASGETAETQPAADSETAADETGASEEEETSYEESDRDEETYDEESDWDEETYDEESDRDEEASYEESDWDEETEYEEEQEEDYDDPDAWE